MKTKSIFLMSVISIFLLSCEKEIHITNPKIFVSPMTPHLFDTITNEMVADIEIDGEKVNADKYEWEIKSDKDSIISIISQNNNKMEWMPKDIGIYTISCNIVSGNKSVKSIEKYQIDYYPPSLYKYLIGNWIVNGKIGNEKEWYATMIINDDYTVNTKLDSVLKGSVSSSIGTTWDDPLIWRYFYITDFIGYNNYSGSFMFSYYIVVTKNIRFSNRLDQFIMEAIFEDYSVEDKERPKITVDFEFKKIK
jgi:hypothetical protein